MNIDYNLKQIILLIAIESTLDNFSHDQWFQINELAKLNCWWKVIMIVLYWYNIIKYLRLSLMIIFSVKLKWPFKWIRLLCLSTNNQFGLLGQQVILL